MSYVVIQVGHESWRKLAALAEPEPKRGDER